MGIFYILLWAINLLKAFIPSCPISPYDKSNSRDVSAFCILKVSAIFIAHESPMLQVSVFIYKSLFDVCIFFIYSNRM